MYTGALARSTASMAGGLGTAFNNLLRPTICRVGASSSMSMSMSQPMSTLPSQRVFVDATPVEAYPKVLVSMATTPKKEKPMQITTVDAQLVRLKPITNGQRHTVLIDKKNLWRGRPVKQLTQRLQQRAGRCRITKQVVVYNRGTAKHKRLYRIIDFKRQMFDEPATIQRFEYDPNRTSFIALIAYPGGNVSYILAAQKMMVGDEIKSSRTDILDIKVGNCMPLKNIPVGTFVHNVELWPGKGGQVVRSAGTSATILDKTGKKGFCLLLIASKEQRYVPEESLATIGAVSNPLHHLRNLGKAGRSRWMGRRPCVRGVAMNPVDHCMGGGEGRSSGGRHSCNWKGLLSKGFKTRKKGPNPLVTVLSGGRKMTKRGS